MTIADASDPAELPRPFPLAGVVLGATHCDAGGTLTGRVAGAAARGPVVLLRYEERPRGERAFAVARAGAVAPDGTFSIAVPDAALPTATGARCALFHVVRAGAPGEVAEAPVVVRTGATPHLDDRGRCRIDRLIPNWDARHFHIEVTDAALRGGGRLAGRVHRDGPWRDGAMTLDVGCRESWRLPPRSARSVPGWGAGWLWRHIARLDIDRHANWAPFDLALPPGLPPAVEARTIAWRYEIVVRRRTRGGLGETAARTPLLHAEAALVWAGE
jgi:hypothetical protein